MNKRASNTLEAEPMVVGILIANYEQARKEVGELKKELFQNTHCKQAVEAILKLEAKGVPIDAVTVMDESKIPASVLQGFIESACHIGAVAYHAQQIESAYLQQKASEIIKGAPKGVEGLRFALQRINEILPAVNGNNGLPAIESGDKFTAREIIRPSEVIKEILYTSGKLVYGGPSKACKTWVLLDLSLAVSTGGEWLGFKCTKGRVLYINLELQPFDAQDRVRLIARSRGISVPGTLDFWNLRGHAVDIEDLKPAILQQAIGRGYSLIVIDPCYKVMGDREENNPRDIASMLNHFEDIAVQSGAAIAYGAHFAKGNASGKNAIDRISGSGVHARDPDAILTATPHTNEGCFTLDATLRSFKQVEPFAIRWEFPRMVKDETLDPADLKQATSGRPVEHSLKDILCFFGDEPISAKKWKQLATEDGVPVRSFYRLRKQAINSKAVIKGEDDTFTRSGGGV